MSDSKFKSVERLFKIPLVRIQSIYRYRDVGF